MRDDDFSEIYVRLAPQLDKYFHTCLKNENYPRPYNDMKRALSCLTASQAFENSRKDSLSGYSIERLLWLKAKNVWKEFIGRKKTEWSLLRDVDEEVSYTPDPFLRMEIKEQLQEIKAKTPAHTWRVLQMVAEGYTLKEIAKLTNETESKIKMEIHRFRKWIRKES